MKRVGQIEILRKANRQKLVARRQVVMSMRESMPHRDDPAFRRPPRRNALRLAMIAVLMLVKLNRAIKAKRELSLLTATKKSVPRPKNAEERSESNSKNTSTVENQKDGLVRGNLTSRTATQAAKGKMSPLMRHTTTASLCKEDSVTLDFLEDDRPPLVGPDGEPGPDRLSLPSRGFLGQNSTVEHDFEDVNGFFPSAKDLEEYPAPIVESIYSSATQSLRRCVDMYRKRRILRFRHSKRILPSDAKIPQQMWDVSIVFQGWPSSALNALASKGYVERCPVGELLFYDNEPATQMKFLIEGTVLQLKRRSNSTKRVCSVTNSTTVCKIEGPRPLRDTATFVEEQNNDAVECISTCEVLVVPLDAVQGVFDTLPPNVKTAVKERVQQKRQTILGKQGINEDQLHACPLFANLTMREIATVAKACQPRSYFQGSAILSTDDSNEKFEAHCVFLVGRGTVQGVTKYRDPHDKTIWRDHVFAVWTAGQSFGEKSVYFQERFVFNIVATTACDLWCLPRQELMLLLMSDRQLKQGVAQGAFAVRCSDPTVRMMFHTIRNMPFVRLGMREGYLTESHVRAIHRMFEFRIFPAKELITSTSSAITEMVVVMVGNAASDVSGPMPFPTPKSVVLGGCAIVSMRWRYATMAINSCEGWALPLEKLLGYLEGLGCLSQLQKLAAEVHEEDLNSDHSKLVMEVRTPVGITAGIIQKLHAARRRGDGEGGNSDGDSSEGDTGGPEGDDPAAETRSIVASEAPSRMKSTTAERAPDKTSTSEGPGKQMAGRTRKPVLGPRKAKKSYHQLLVESTGELRMVQDELRAQAALAAKKKTYEKLAKEPRFVLHTPVIAPEQGSEENANAPGELRASQSTAHAGQTHALLLRRGSELQSENTHDPSGDSMMSSQSGAYSPLGRPSTDASPFRPQQGDESEQAEPLGRLERFMMRKLEEIHRSDEADDLKVNQGRRSPSGSRSMGSRPVTTGRLAMQLKRCPPIAQVGSLRKRHFTHFAELPPCFATKRATTSGSQNIATSTSDSGRKGSGSIRDTLGGSRQLCDTPSEVRPGTVGVVLTSKASSRRSSVSKQKLPPLHPEEQVEW